MSQKALVSAFEEVVKSRRSVRAYLDTPVPIDILEKVFKQAGLAPSNCNTQPWVTHVASGKSLETLRSLLPERTAANELSLDFPYDGRYPVGDYQNRQYDAANQMYNAVGIDRSDKQKRHEMFMQNYSFFGAPHAAFLFLPEVFGLREAADIGIFAQTLMLSLSAHGIASIPQTSLGFHADSIRKVLGIDSSMKLLFGISFGYEDTSADINKCRIGRANLEDLTFFHP